jgi:hypothetical protein
LAIKSFLKVKLQLLALLLTIIIPSTALASVITGADYTGTITVTNNGTAATNVSTIMTLNSASLINNFGVAPDFSDVVIRNDAGADVVFQPSVNSTYPWVLWDSSIAANNAQTMSIYLKDVSGGKLRWFPGAGGMTVADSATMEPSSNFSMEWKGYVDTAAAKNTDNSTSKYLGYKKNAIEVNVDPVTSGTITAKIAGNWTLPTAHIDAGGSCIDEAQAYDGNTGTDSTWDLSVPASNYTGEIQYNLASAIKVDRIRIWTSSTGNGTVDLDIYNGGAWKNISETAVTDGAYNSIPLGATYSISEFRVRIKNTTVGPLGSMSINEINFGAFYSVSAAGIASGEKTITVTENTEQLGISVNSVQADYFPFIDAYTKLQLHCDGADASVVFTDSSLAPHAVTRVAIAEIDTAQSKFGGASGYFNNGGVLTCLDSDDWYFGTGDFTIDFWIRFQTNTTNAMQFAAQYNGASGYWYLIKTSANKLQMKFKDAAGTTMADYITASSAPFVINTWYHIAFERYGTSALIFVNGQGYALTATTAFGVNDVGNLVSEFAIGRDWFIGGGNNINGWIDDFRISKGIARWTTR